MSILARLCPIIWLMALPPVPVPSALFWWCRRHCGVRLREALETLGADLRQVRPGAVDAARPAAGSTSPTSWRSCRTGCRRSPSNLPWPRSRTFAGRLDQVFDKFEREPVASAVRRAGAFCGAARAAPRSRSKCCARASRRRSRRTWLAGDARPAARNGCGPDGRRLKPREVVAEFDKHLHDELDLMREAANASQLRRNFAGSPAARGARGALGLLFAARDGDGTHARHADIAGRELREQGIDIPRLARAGVEIFFTQVFRDGFFHADMHPGNILVRRRRQVHRARFRHHGHAHRRRQELPGAEFPRLLQPRLHARGAGAPRRGLGAGRHAAGRVRGRDPRGVRADLRAAAEGDLFRQAAAAPVPDLAPLQRRDPAAARDAAEDAAQHRRAWAASSIPTWTSGRRRSRSSSAG